MVFCRAFPALAVFKIGGQSNVLYVKEHLPGKRIYVKKGLI